MRIVSGAQMKQIDQSAISDGGISGLFLMENAGAALCDCILDELKNQRLADAQDDPDEFEYMKKDDNNHFNKVVIVCGGGNNGGDGYVVARRLLGAGLEVSVFSTVNVVTLLGDAKTNYFEYVNQGNKVIEISNSDQIEAFAQTLYEANVVVDAIFGTGISRKIEGVVFEVIEAINACSSAVISADIPSGVGADDGKVYGIAIGATKTVTFQFLKIGCVAYPGREYCGELIVEDIGITWDISQKVLGDAEAFFQINDTDVREVISPRPKNFHKGNAGKVLMIAGSKGMAGAAILSTRAALRAGAGLVTAAVPDELNDIMQISVPEAICLVLDKDGNTSNEKHVNQLKNYDVIAAGPGMGKGNGTKESIERLLQNIEKPMIIDADGITVLSENLKMLKESKGKVILTPHPGEFAKLLGVTAREVNENRIALAKTFAAEYNVILVLKGETTLICSPEGKMFFNKSGNPGMATGGSGDVLTGILAAFVGQFGFSARTAAIAVYVHGKAGDMMAQTMGETGLIASDLTVGVSLAIAQMQREWQNL